MCDDCHIDFEDRFSSTPFDKKHVLELELAIFPHDMCRKTQTDYMYIYIYIVLVKRWGSKKQYMILLPFQFSIYRGF